MPEKNSQGNNLLTYRWLVGVLGTVIFFGLTFWVTSVQASINKLEDGSYLTASLQTQIDLMQKQLERIEVKVDKLQ